MSTLWGTATHLSANRITTGDRLAFPFGTWTLPLYGKTRGFRSTKPKEIVCFASTHAISCTVDLVKVVPFELLDFLQHRPRDRTS
jgi:hypothetical protein